MIQRIQTIWLLAASACGFITLQLPFYIGSIGALPAERFTALGSLPLLILTIAAAITGFVAIFLYKNRSLQLKLTLAAFAVAIINIALFFSKTQAYNTGGIALSSVFAFAAPVFYALAIRNIYRDQKLVKSIDRLR